MPTFQTPEPVRATIEVAAGDVTVRATDTSGTTVAVVPARPGAKGDIEAAEGTTVGFADGRLEVRTPKLKLLGLLGRTPAVSITVDLPARSDVVITTGFGDIEVAGTVGRCRARTHAGDIRVEDADVVDVETSAGDVTIRRARSDAEARSLAGDVTLDELSGRARIKSSAGGIRIGATNGDLTATAPYGRVQVREATSGSLTLTTSYADIDVGVPEGTAARLDVQTGHGRIRNELTTSAEPPPSSYERVDVTVRTSYGQVTIKRP